MASAEYEIFLETPAGVRVAALPTTLGFRYTLKLNDVGVLTLTLPAEMRELFQNDSIIDIWRNSRSILPTGGSSGSGTFWLARRFTRRTDQSGRRVMDVTAVNAMHVLKRRIVAYKAGSTQAGAGAGWAADTLLQIIYESNFVDWLGANPAERQVPGFSAPNSSSDGPRVSRRFAYRNCLNVMQDIAATSLRLGMPLFFMLYRSPNDISGNPYIFQTYTNQQGTDRRISAGGVPVGAEYGNLEQVQFDENALDEVNVIYAGGQGEEDNRQLLAVGDDARIAQSPFGRIEAFYDGRNSAESHVAFEEALARLHEGRPLITLSGRILDVPGFEYGIDWEFGDRLTAVYEDYSFDAFVNAISVSYQDGEESIDSWLEGVTS
jgi:hypothetical protein